MTGHLDGVEAYLKVGQSVIFYPEGHRPDGPRHEVAIRGWQKGAYILLEMTPLPTRSILLREKADCSLRFLIDGIACSMDACVIDWQVSRKKPTFSVSWPKAVRTAAIRRTERVDVNIPCTLYFNNGEVPATALDLSVGGCGLESPRAPQRDQSIITSLTLPDGVFIDRAPFIVKSVREVQSGRYHLGCLLDGGNSTARIDIEFYVTTTLLRRRGLSNGTAVVLILDSELTSDATLSAQLREQGFEVHIRSNLIDGISSARLRLPAALLVRHDWPATNAVDFCRILRTSPVLAGVPIIVYGAPEDAHATLTASGAQACYTTIPDARAIAGQVQNHSTATVPH